MERRSVQRQLKLMSAQVRAGDRANEHGDLVDPGAESDGADADDGCSFFQVVHASPGRMRVIPQTILAGGRLPYNSLALAPHKV
eukprot:9478751-Alexandrium_andersonii.AAC.1